MKNMTGDDLVRMHRHAAAPAVVGRDGFAQHRQAGRRPVVRKSLGERLLAGAHDVLRRVEVRLPDFQVNDVPALRFERAGAREHFKGGFCAQPGHARGELHAGKDIKVRRSGVRRSGVRSAVPRARPLLSHR
jgi:hypothetical protein